MRNGEQTSICQEVPEQEKRYQENGSERGDPVGEESGLFLKVAAKEGLSEEVNLEWKREMT